MDVVTLGAALSIMKKMPDTAASSAAAAEDAADRAEEAARTLTIDDTLTKPGQPADSKAVGDTLAEKLDIADLPDTVSSANQLLSEKYIVDTEPYHLRPSGGNGADRAYDTIVGGSVIWNQLIGNDIKAANKVFDATTSTYQHYLASATLSIKSGHKYFLTINGSRTISDNDAINYSLMISGNTKLTGVAFANGEADGVKSIIFAPENDYEQSIGISSNNYYGKRGYSAGDSVSYDNLQLFDLTQMFGSEIADYIYSIEQATTGAGIAWFKKYFPNAYYEYSSVGFAHVSGVSAHKLYDADNNVIGNYPLDSSLTLRGIPKLTDGKLIFDGDIYKSDGTVERRYKEIKLKDISWGYVSASGVFRANNNYGASTDGMCDSYSVAKTTVSSTPDMSIVFGSKTWDSNCRMFIKDSRFTDAASLIAAMGETTIIFAPAAPSTEQAEPYQSPQILDPNGTEEYVTTSPVPVGHETKYPENLRSKIDGLPWNFASLIAPVEAEFKATRNYTSGSLFIVNNVLYKATANIANGGDITPNTNCITTTLAEIIAAL